MVTAKKDSNNYGSSVDEKHSENRDYGNNGSRIEVQYIEMTLPNGLGKERASIVMIKLMEIIMIKLTKTRDKKEVKHN